MYFDENDLGKYKNMNPINVIDLQLLQLPNTKCLAQMKPFVYNELNLFQKLTY